MTSLTCCISIVASPPCGSSSFPAYHRSAWVQTMPSGLLLLVFICFPHPSLQNVFRIRMCGIQLPQRGPFFGGKHSRRVSVSIYSRHVRVIFEISRQTPKISKKFLILIQNVFCIRMYGMQLPPARPTFVLAGKNSRYVRVHIYSRHVRVIFGISHRNPKILQFVSFQF